MTWLALASTHVMVYKAIETYQWIVQVATSTRPRTQQAFVYCRIEILILLTYLRAGSTRQFEAHMTADTV